MEDWIGKPLRQKCLPFPLADQQELEQQAGELLKVGLAGTFAPGQIPHFYPTTFLVDKKGVKDSAYGYPSPET